MRENSDRLIVAGIASLPGESVVDGVRAGVVAASGNGAFVGFTISSELELKYFATVNLTNQHVSFIPNEGLPDVAVELVSGPAFKPAAGEDTETGNCNILAIPWNDP